MLCFTCIGKLVEPTTRCSRDCSGIRWICPVCRVQACLTPTQVLGLLKGSRKKVRALFSDCERSMQRWNEQSTQ